MAVHLTTIGFVAAEIFECTMKHLYEDKMLSVPGLRHWFLYQHWPLNKAENCARLKAVCERYGITWVDSGYDRGLHHGSNYLWEQIKPANDDVVLGMDPDDWPATQGWDQALVDVLSAGPEYPLVCLDNYHNLAESPRCQFLGEIVGGRRVLVPINRPVMQTISGMQPRWLRNIGGFHQPTTFYGHMESYLWRRLEQTHKRMAILLDFRHEYGHVPAHDKRYTDWKLAQALSAVPGARPEQQTRDSFADWLAKRGVKCD